MRPSGRKLDEMRSVSVEVGFTKHAEGSALIKVGDTHVLCTATIEDRVAAVHQRIGPWLGHSGVRHAAPRHEYTDAQAGRNAAAFRTARRNRRGCSRDELPEPDETEDTFVGNARIKAHAAASATGMPALSDDSGIQVEALDNAPGVYTADWAETPNGRDFLMAMTKTHNLLEEKSAPHPRRARFCATMVLAWPDWT
ncbi:dITP/XTP pyrophosphatase [Nymphon striatum]|nr:dITP/XTP pyrophosphatase [Nymphon striatum]